jgi:hypothetical protein
VFAKAPLCWGSVVNMSLQVPNLGKEMVPNKELQNRKIIKGTQSTQGQGVSQQINSRQNKL